MNIQTRMLVPACIAAVIALGAGPAAYADAVPGIWQAKQAKFHYFGFTSKYTCDGLKSKVKLLLRSLGARDDVQVQGACANGAFHEPQVSHNLVIGFSIPVPADAQGAPGETFPAEWREVRLRENSPRSLDRGDCELVDQLRRQVLPLFNPREMKDSSTCTPHQINLGDPNLRLTVLMPVADPATGTAQD